MCRTVIMRNLGKMGFKEALDIQTSLVEHHLRTLAKNGSHSDEVLDTLLVVEHTPCYTIGIRTSSYSDDDQERLLSLGAEFHVTNRGGLITFHGPGQLVAYPILYLGHYHKSVKWYVHNLEQTLISTCQRFGVAAHRSHHTGVWVQDRKIAAIGIHARRYVTSHGIALNCNVDLGWFEHIVPCGIPNHGVTSLTKELATDITVTQALAHLKEAFAEHFECNLIY